MTQPATVKLEQIEQQPLGLERAQALSAYIKEGEARIATARRLRDEDFRLLVDLHGKAKAARLLGVSLSTVKLAVGRKTA